MKKVLINRFFRELDRELDKRAEVIVTGAAAGSLLGVARPSLDIDFEIRIHSSGGPAHFAHCRDAIERAAQKTGIAVNYSEDIGHGSMIDLLDYRKQALPYQQIGKLQIRLMSPEYWTIGKMDRFLEVDLRDILRMIKRRQLKSQRLISLWGRALTASPLSLNSGSFSRNVTHFIERYGKKIWGRDFDTDRAVILFKKTAGIAEES